MELSALERLKYPHRLIMGKMVSPLFHDCFDPICFILAAFEGNENMHFKSLDEFKFRLDLNTTF